MAQNVRPLTGRRKFQRIHALQKDKADKFRGWGSQWRAMVLNKMPYFTAFSAAQHGQGWTQWPGAISRRLKSMPIDAV